MLTRFCSLSTSPKLQPFACSDVSDHNLCQCISILLLSSSLLLKIIPHYCVLRYIYSFALNNPLFADYLKSISLICLLCSSPTFPNACSNIHSLKMSYQHLCSLAMFKTELIIFTCKHIPSDSLYLLMVSLF